MARKPQNLIYGVDDTPPPLVTIMLGIQHVFLVFVSILFPVFIVQQLGVKISPEEAQSFLSMSMIAGGIVTIIQSYRIGPVGSGYLCPALSGPSYFDATKTAAAMGGLPLIFGMTLFAGVIESFFSRIMHKLRFLFPVEVVGLIVTMVGIVVIPISVESFFGLTAESTGISQTDAFVALFTIAIMIGLNVWTGGNLKVFCTLIGIVAGYLLAIVLNLIPPQDIQRLNNAEYISFPKISHIRWAFDFSLLIPFIVATICSTFKTVGDLVTCQKINDADWKRPDMKNISNGILADGLGGVIPGVIGGFGQSTSSSNIGMSLATAATSRLIAIPLGVIFMLLGFFPKLSEIFIIMPKPVMGAAMVFSVSFMITTGLQIMMSRMLDARKIFVIGASLIFGLSVDMVPGLYADIHPWIRPVFSSTLSLAAISAIVLNLLFRMGISKKETIVINQGEDISGKLFNFMDKQGGAWGARKDVFAKATSALTEMTEFLLCNGFAEGPVEIKLSFDEFNLDARFEYKGKALELAKERPSEKEILEEDGAAKLSLYIISRYSDKIRTDRKGNINFLHLHFEH